MMDAFLELYLPLFVFGYLLITFVLPSWRVYKQTGINPVTFGKRDTAHDYIGALMKATTALLVVAVSLYSVWKEAYAYLLPVPYLQRPWIKVSGLVLIHGALLWIVAAQHQMRNSWRIGIDEKNKTALVTSGVFGWSRNPVFAGMLASVLGLFFILPNALTLVVLALSYVLIHIQIRLEEEFLLRQHGEVYLDYKKRVRRML